MSTTARLLPAVLLRAVLAAPVALPPAAGAAADDGAYAGVMAGVGRMDNRLTDIDGFANWGNPGAATEYDDRGLVGGAVLGTGVRPGGLPLRVEIEGMFGNLAATTNMLDPEGLDESAKAALRWAVAARLGVAFDAGPLTLFAAGGPAAARIENSATDMDRSGLDDPWRRDPDDSFRDSSVEFGWSVGAGAETAIADGWALRLEGVWMDFGAGRHAVNRAGDNRCCGAGTERRPVAYEVENAFAIARLALVRRFDP